MGCFNQISRKLLAHNGVEETLMAGVDTTYDQLAADQKDVVYFGNPKSISERTRARGNLEILRQGLLHRTLCLAKAVNTLVPEGNVHAIALSIRGQLEATAQLGYFCHRLTALAKRRVTFDDFHYGLAQTLLAASSGSLTHAFEPTNVLTYFDKADRHFERELGGKEAGAAGLLRESYDWMSDYCHPNFLSSASSFILDKERHEIRFQHNKPLLARNNDLFSAFRISLSMFEVFWSDLKVRSTALDGG